MKKTIALIASITLLLSVNYALAKPSPDGDPFQAVWNAISNLQEQITNIQLTPGPAGPQGPQGELGLQGVQGEPGQAGTNLKVVDAENNMIGFLLNTAYKETMGQVMYFTIFNPDKDLVFSLSLDGRPVTEPGNTRTDAIYYTSLDCSGNEYIPGRISPQSLIVWEIRYIPYNQEYYRVNDFSDYGSYVELNSFKDNIGSCYRDTRFGPATKIYKATGFIYPGPLRIVND